MSAVTAKYTPFVPEALGCTQKPPPPRDTKKLEEEREPGREALLTARPIPRLPLTSARVSYTPSGFPTVAPVPTRTVRESRMPTLTTELRSKIKRTFNSISFDPRAKGPGLSDTERERLVDFSYGLSSTPSSF